ncbi:hypothetical protein BS50DRAFT_500528 [Corynespora cassiicola Philippines]|uniref:Uncharacterized protein n=1 Tax=Corynespora cassiicola Philippines TaxID=1448308 RepID=A0A2T2NCR6_CORCC|nr:hypothetical protein BS50DRAFT_500528 [Corynespora cassiicola Philippines]
MENFTPPPASPQPALTQEMVNADPTLKRFQQDLLVLTSFSDNTTLHWRPAWFTQGPYASQFWTLHNPPNVITERLPYTNLSRATMTRRMRTEADGSPLFIKTWEQWGHYCELYGVPADFLCEEQVQLMRLGLCRDAGGELSVPPTFPLYPEPQPQAMGRYLLDTRTYLTHLPRKFHGVDPQATGEVVVVHSNGALRVEDRWPYFMHRGQWSHFNGRGEYVEDAWYDADPAVPKEQGPGRRWAHVPWTREQEESCEPRVVRLRIVEGGELIETPYKGWKVDSN